ncbi:DUF6773 family protein [Clostridium sp. WILCCON 0269]|uniref:DUF6773 family protein n=1 Tax=Candidatus Clostridium eludens TaxID=3381663 RepID=A0ABW8SNX3_9CLOT
MEKNKLDEMQLQQRNKIGNQSFILLCWLIILDSIIYGLGVRWLQYPANTFFIMCVCITYYIVRLACSSALIGVKDKHSNIKKLILHELKYVLIAVVVSIIIAKSNLIKIKGTIAQNNDLAIACFSALIMVIIGVIITVIVTKKVNKDDE